MDFQNILNILMELVPFHFFRIFLWNSKGLPLAFFCWEISRKTNPINPRGLPLFPKTKKNHEVSSGKGTDLSKVINWQNDTIFHSKSERGIFWHAPNAIKKWRITFIFYVPLNKPIKIKIIKGCIWLMFRKRRNHLKEKGETIFQNKN